MMHDKGAPLVENVVNERRWIRNLSTDTPKRNLAITRQSKGEEALQQTRRKRGKRRGRGR